MLSFARYMEPPRPCSYLHDQMACLEYEEVVQLAPVEYLERMQAGWRRFGYTLFRPRCRHCSACQSLRVDVEHFRPSRSQRRVWTCNQGDIKLLIESPSVSAMHLDLYDRYHAFQAGAKDWPDRTPEDSGSYRSAFVDNPFPSEQWRYERAGNTIGIGYVDSLPDALSAIYFFYDPEERRRSLGTWNILSMIDQAARRGIRYVYLGYYIAGCQSMEYKARFVPNQILGLDGHWRPFQTI